MEPERDADPLRLLGRAAAALNLDNLPPEVLQRAKQRVLDALGCLVAGYEGHVAETIRSYVLAQGGNAEATLLPGGEKTTAALAGFAHATCIYGLELSDCAPRGTVHPGCKVVPIALAVAERGRLGGAAVLPALVAGYEVEIRFARTVHPHAWYRGWKPLGIFGAIGPAVAAGHIMGLDADGLDNAIGIALNLAPMATGRTNQIGSAKWLFGGQACTSGLLAAEMSGHGFKGMRDVVGGWLNLVSEQNHPERLTEGIDAQAQFTQWELLSGVVTKYHATIGPLVSPIEAVFSLLQQHDIRPEDVVEIHADCTHRTAVFNKPHPESEVTARASLPYCLAVAVCTRDPGQLLGAAYKPDALRNETVRALAEKVRVTANDEYERQYPARSLARVTIRLRNGLAHSLEVDRSALGRYLAPTDADIEQKFRLLATPVLGRDRADTVVGLVGNLESLSDLGELLAALRVSST